MQSAPDDLTDATLAAALTLQWGVAVAELAYRPVGFGSHHWAVTDPAGGRWFATVDDLHARRVSRADPLDETCRRLGAALDTARALHDSGAAFVVAPIRTAGGATVVRLAPRYAASFYPYVDGESFRWGPFPDDTHRTAALVMIRDVHAAPSRVTALAYADDLGVPHRDALEIALDGAAPTGTGPYAQRTADLLAAHEESVRGLLAEYDGLVARADRSRAVLTHGEPHVANTMRTGDGWRLIDWETALVAPPERDLWFFDADMHASYTAATGVAVLPEMLRLYRLGWDLADLAIGVDRFARPHDDGTDDDSTWAVVERVAGEVARS